MRGKEGNEETKERGKKYVVERNEGMKEGSEGMKEGKKKEGEGRKTLQKSYLSPHTRPPRTYG